MANVRALASWLLSFLVRAALAWLRAERPAFVNSAPIPPRWDAVREILVIKLDGIGDAVLLSPFLRELRRMSPAARITYVASRTAAPLLEQCPHVDEVLVFDCDVPRLFRPFGHALRAFRLGRRISQNRAFDVAIVPRWDTDGAYAGLVVAGTSAPVRITYSERTTPRKQFLNRGFDALYTFAYYPQDTANETVHEVLRNLDLLSAVGGRPGDSTLEAWPDAKDETAASAVLASIPVQAKRVVALGIGAGAPHRQWPVDRFAALADWLWKELGAVCVLIGGRGDLECAGLISDAINVPCVDVVSRVSLLQTAALLKHCDLYVGNDTGPMHLAAAAGKPIVEISAHAQDCPDWHWNSPARFGPWNVPNRILRPERCAEPCRDSCSADDAHCIRGIAVSAVTDAIKGLIEQIEPESNGR